MKTIEPLGVTETGAVSVRVTYDEGETMTELGLDADQSARLWAQLNADWDARFVWKYRIGRLSFRAEPIGRQPWASGSNQNENGRAWWIDVCRWRIGFTLWNRAAETSDPR